MDNEKVTGGENEGEEFLGDLIELTDEDGVKHSFELVDTLDKDDKTYVALIAGPDDEEMLDGDGSLVIMRIVSQDGEDEVLEMIEDEDEFDEISEIFMDRLSDLYEFDEDDEDGCCCGHHHDDDDDDDKCCCGHHHDDDDDDNDDDDDDDKCGCDKKDGCCEH